MSNPAGPIITLGDSIDNDATITFTGDPNARDNAWITIDPGNGEPAFSLNIVRGDEGIIFDVYLTEDEDDSDGPAATTYAFFADSPATIGDDGGDEEVAS